jgi:hypothetical protein
MEQADNYEFHREKMELDQEAEQSFKDMLNAEQMTKLENYFTDVYDVMSDDPDTERARFDEWFNDQHYQDLLAILNK